MNIIAELIRDPDPKRRNDGITLLIYVSDDLEKLRSVLDTNIIQSLLSFLDLDDHVLIKSIFKAFSNFFVVETILSQIFDLGCLEKCANTLQKGFSDPLIFQIISKLVKHASYKQKGIAQIQGLIILLINSLIQKKIQSALDPLLILSEQESNHVHFTPESGIMSYLVHILDREHPLETREISLSIIFKLTSRNVSYRLHFLSLGVLSILSEMCNGEKAVSHSQKEQKLAFQIILNISSSMTSSALASLKFDQKPEEFKKVTVEYSEEKLLLLAKNLANNIELRDIKIMLRTFKNVTSGREIVDSLKESEELSTLSYEEIINICEQLRVAGFIICVSEKKKTFSDDLNNYYKFSEKVTGKRVPKKAFTQAKLNLDVISLEKIKASFTGETDTDNENEVTIDEAEESNPVPHVKLGSNGIKKPTPQYYDHWKNPFVEEFRENFWEEDFEAEDVEINWDTLQTFIEELQPNSTREKNVL